MSGAAGGGDGGGAAKPKRRFIAGAVCPQCGAEDRIALLAAPEGGLPSLECAACGMHKVLDEMMGGAPGGQVPDNPAEVVRWVEAE